MHIKTSRNRYAKTLLLLAFAVTKAHAQFDIEDSNTTASLRGIHNVGGGVAWASGTNGTVLRTEDGGYLWQTCTTPPGAEKLDFRGIQAFDENTAIVMSSGKGDLSRLYKTTDGCQTWNLLFTNPDKEGFWDAIKFSSKDHDFGALLGDPVNGIFVIMLTRDGGTQWEPQFSRSPEAPRINGVSVFAASNSSLLISSPDELVFGTGGFAGPCVVSSKPAGQKPKNFNEEYQAVVSGKFKPLVIKWLPGKSTRSDTSGIFSLAATDHSSDMTIVAVGGDFARPDDRDGTAWTNAFENSSDPEKKFDLRSAQTPPHGYRSSVAYDPTQKLWITVGPNGTDISTDDGKNWQPLKPSGYDPPDADKNWNALSLPFVVGPHGRIGRLRTITQK
jgi:hypothetical protein